MILPLLALSIYQYWAGIARDSKSRVSPHSLHLATEIIMPVLYHYICGAADSHLQLTSTVFATPTSSSPSN